MLVPTIGYCNSIVNVLEIEGKEQSYNFMNLKIVLCLTIFILRFVPPDPTQVLKM